MNIRVLSIGFSLVFSAVAIAGRAAAADAPAPVPANAPVIVIDGQDAGRVFDGIGALSAGASSRLLIDYPEPQRSEILDYLFKPNFGAVLQINKVEIGGEMNSTDGSEPSHMRTATEENYRRGYEWWLMVESKKRNPAVKLSGLEWGAPYWINPVKNTVYTKENVDYIVKWVQHAKSDYGLDIDYIGGWTERAYDADWYKLFRAGLNAAGLGAVKVVSDDAFNWSVGRGMKKDPAFGASFEIVGMHYSGAVPKADAKEGWQTCVDSGKPLWASEIGSGHYHRGAKGLARLYNQGYIGSKMSSYINWSTIWSVLPGQPYSGCGLMLADQPWSGHYEVGLSIWATAHTTQFTQPGWQYLDRGCTLFMDGSNALGSCVALRSPDRKDFSVIVETIDARTPRSVAFAVEPGLPRGPLHVWKTNMNGKASEWFVRQADVNSASGKFTMTFDPGCVYTISTVAAAHKGETTPPPAAMQPLPYREDFQSYQLGATPKYISDQHGAFEVAKAGGGREGKCLRQVITAKPVCWNSDADPGTIVGDLGWRNYRVSVDALLEQPGYVELAGRISGPTDQNKITGYHLRLDDKGRWSLRWVAHPHKKTDPAEKELAAGNLPQAPGTGTWHKLSLDFLGSRIQPAIDGVNMGEPIEDTTFKHGLVGLITSRWATSQYMNLEVLPNGPQPSAREVGQGMEHRGARILECDSEAPSYEAALAIDGNPETFWHTVWQPKPAPFPHSIAVDLGSPRTLRGITLVPRPDQDSGRAASIDVYVSDSRTQWGEPAISATLHDEPELEEVLFKTPVTGRYLKVVIKSSQRQNPHTAIAELDVLE